MSDTFEFDDNDDILLNSVCTPASENIKGMKEPNSLIDVSKKPKLDNSDDSFSPVFSGPESRTHIINFYGKTDRVYKQATHSSENSGLNAIKRIFPGPAGILADGNQMETCSQRTSSIFQDGPWEEMSKDFKISSSTYLYDSFNIAWIKKEAIANHFADQKAPFLAAVLLSLEVSDGRSPKSVNVTLKDMTGSIQGNILYSLYQDYASHFILGSVLILVQFGVLSCTCDKCENHHLTITPKNLSAIYNNKTKIIIKKIEPDEILSEFCQRKKELALKTRNYSLMKHNSTSGMSFNNKTRPQNIFRNNRLSSNNVSTKLRPVSENLLENKTSTNTEKYIKSFSFKKRPLAQEPISESKTSNNLILNINHKNSTSCTENNIAKNKNVPINLNNDGYSKNALETRSETAKANESTNNSESVKKLKKRFSFKKTPSPEEGHRDTIILSNEIINNHNENMQHNVSHSFINTGENEISVKADKREYEELWKDVLNDVDINSFFDEDF